MAGQETLIYIEENDKNEAGINARHFAKEDVQNRAYYNTLGAQLIKKFLASENVDATNTYNIHTIKKVLEELDISDIMLGNIHIEVRVIFNENFIFIPKSHFQYEILPDIYLVLLMSNDKKYVKFMGFFEPKLINKNNQNEDYYFIEKEKLTPASNLKEYIENFKGNTEQPLSDEEIDTSDMLILSMIDHDITEQEKKTLLKNLVKSAKLRDRFIEFENFEALSYRAEQSSEIKKTEFESGYPSLEVAAAATAEALEQLDIAGSANTQNLPDENEIINGFTNLERNIPDLTPDESSTETANTSVDDMLSELTDFSDLTELTGDEVMNRQETVTKPSDDEISIDDFSVENTTAAPSTETFQNQPAEDVSTEDFDSLTMDFNDIVEDNIAEINEQASVSGIIEQQNTPETLNFDEIMPLETSKTETPADTVSQEETSAETVDFSVLEDMTAVQPEDKITDLETETQTPNTMDFDDISTDSELTDIAPEIIEPENQTPPENEVVDFENLSTPLTENTEEEETASAKPEDTATIQPSEDISEEPELLFEEPLQELSFDDTELTLEEPLLDIAEEEEKDTPVQTEEPAKMSTTETDTSELEDFDSLVLQDEKAHGIEREEKTVENSLSTEPSEILPEDIELDKMLAEENLTELADTAVEPLSNEAALENTDTKEQSADNLTPTEEVPTAEATSNEEISEVAAESEESAEPESTLQPTIPPLMESEDQSVENSEDTITDLNLDADEIEKSTVTDDIAGVEGFDDTQNTTDLSADELISQIDDLLGTQEQGETSNAETSASEELQEESSDKDDKLEMLFNNQNYDIDSTTNNFNEEFETDTNDDTPNYTGAKATQDKGKQAILAAAVVAVLAIAGGAGFFLLKSKSSTDILAQNPIESDGTNIPAPTENPSEADNTNLMTNSPDINAQIPTPKAPDAQKPSTPAPKAKPTTKQPAPQAKPTPAAASTQSKAPGNTPLPYVTVRSLTWEVPDYLSYSDKVKKYLQTAGKSIRLTLSSDLLLATEYAYSNQVKVEIKLKNDGSVQDAQITKSSGSNQINDIVLRTVKDTLNVVKPAPGEIPTPDFKLGLIINL